MGYFFRLSKSFPSFVEKRKRKMKQPASMYGHH